MITNPIPRICSCLPSPIKTYETDKKLFSIYRRNYKDVSSFLESH